MKTEIDCERKRKKKSLTRAGIHELDDDNNR